MVKKFVDRIEARLLRRGSLGAALIKGAVGTAGLRLGHAALGFVTAIVLAKLLGPSGYGTYSFVVALVAFLAIPSELGVPGLAVREIAVTNARKDWGQMRGFILRAHQAILLLSLVPLILAAVGLIVWGDRIDSARRTCMWLGLLALPLLSLGSLRGGMLRGLRKVVLGQLPELIIRPLVLLILVLLLSSVGAKLDSPNGVMTIQVFAVATAFLSGLVFFTRNRPPELARAETRPSSIATLLKSSIPFGLAAAMFLVNRRTDVVVLGIFRADAEVGIYRVALQFASVIAFALQAVNTIQSPHIAHLYVKGDMQTLQKMITRGSQAVLAYALPTVLVIVLFGEAFIRAAFGEQYLAAYVPLVILAIGQLANVSMGSVASLLNMTGHERDTTRIVLIGAIVNLILNFSLTPIWGMNGAAIATASGLTAWNMLMRRQVRKRTGIEPSALFRLRFWSQR